MKTKIDSIEIPDEFLTLCADWHAGQSCTLYAISSTGGLTLGNRRPLNCDTDEKWYLQLWLNLSSDLGSVLRLAKRNHQHDDVAQLEEFEQFVSKTIDQLRTEYGLEDWDGE